MWRKKSYVLKLKELFVLISHTPKTTSVSQQLFYIMVRILQHLLPISEPQLRPPFTNIFPSKKTFMAINTNAAEKIPFHFLSFTSIEHWELYFHAKLNTMVWDIFAYMAQVSVAWKMIRDIQHPVLDTSFSSVMPSSLEWLLLVKKKCFHIYGIFAQLRKVHSTARFISEIWQRRKFQTTFR